jgi:hypothetical protein
MKTTKRTEIIVETDRILIIRQRRGEVRLCDQKEMIEETNGGKIMNRQTSTHQDQGWTLSSDQTEINHQLTPALAVTKGLETLRKGLLGMLFLALVPALAFGQDPKERRSWGYGFFAPGAVSSEYGSTAFLHVGGGGEGLIYKGLGAGAEFGYHTDGAFILSVNGAYHFSNPRSPRKAVPFVTGGYVRGFPLSEDSGNGLNFGAGVNYWLRDRIGLRFEFRDHLSPQTFIGHLWQVRIGIVGR